MNDTQKALAIRLQGEGYTIRQISQELGLPKSSVHDALKASKAQLGQASDQFDRMYLKGPLRANHSAHIVPITGSATCKISDAGMAWRNGQRIIPVEVGQWRANKHKNGHKFRTRAELAVFLGHDYAGPVAAIGKTTDPNWWSEWTDSAAAPLRERQLRPLDEVVAYEFLPHPRFTSRSELESLTLRHLDGDEQNCSADNLEWVSTPKHCLGAVSLMRHDLPRRASKASRHRGQQPSPRWTSSNCLPGHTPTSPQREV